MAVDYGDAWDGQTVGAGRGYGDAWDGQSLSRGGAAGVTPRPYGQGGRVGMAPPAPAKANPTVAKFPPPPTFGNGGTV